MFGTDRTLLYNVQPWADLGFGVPNFGENVGTLNNAIARLVDEVGKSQLYIMLSVDAMRTKPPSRNTVERLAKLIMRVQTVLGSRQQAYNELRLEAGHATPAQEIFTIHPCPFFTSAIVRNPWLREYNNLTMVALANMMQHSDNNVPLTITAEFSKAVWQWFRQIKILMGADLLMLNPTELADDKFVFTSAHFDAYDPMAKINALEAVDTPSDLWGLPTEDDIQPLFDGLPANVVRNVVRQYPVSLPDNGPVAGQNPAGGALSETPPVSQTTSGNASAGLEIGKATV